MSARHPQLAGRLVGAHPAVRDRRIHELMSVAGIGLVPLILGLAIAVAYPNPNPFLLFGVVIGVIGVLALLLSRRYEVTLALVMLYLGLLDGPVKLEIVSQVASGLRDILILAVVLGMGMRLVVSKERILLPPLSRWVLAFVAFVLIEAVNPRTASVLKSLGGYRQLLEWVPFFFFGYLLLRTKTRFRQFFVLLGVIALANGIVGTVQSRLGPAQLANWGPGYRELAFGGEGNGITGRTYSVEGVAHVRPPALGSDAGFGGGVGALALPCLLALLAASPLRRKWPVMILCIGAVLGIATAASRTSVVIGVLGLLSFAVLSFVAGLKLSRALVGLMVTGVIVVAIGSVLIAANGSGIFSRQETLTSVQSAQESGGKGKLQSLSEMPHFLIAAPFGYGLGTTGSAAGFGGNQRVELEGEKVNAGSAYAILMKEVGIPGLLLWLGLTVNVLSIAVKRLRRIEDVELRTYLVGLVAGFAALTFQGFGAPTLAVTIGAFLWFVPGVVAWWLAGPLRGADGTEPAAGAQAVAGGHLVGAL
jgi:hypothetical protein